MASRTRDNYSQFIDELGLVHVPGEELSEQDLVALCEAGEKMSSSSAFLRGDVANLAKEKYGSEWFSHLSFKTKPQTLNNYSSVCNQFPRERRRWKLPFRFYDAVKGVKDRDEQEAWLDRAEKEEISSDILRQAIRKATNTRRMSEQMQVGMIDLSLMEDFGVPEGTLVRVLFEIVMPENVIQLAEKQELKKTA